MKKTVRVVVVDDNEAVIRSVKDYFRTSDVVKVIAGFKNGHDALEYLLMNKNDYDIVMLDLILTGIDGIRIIEELNNQKLNKKIMVLSSFKDDFTIKRVQNLGASYFMLKPIDMEIVNNRILDLINHKKEAKVMKSTKIESEVSTLLHELGIPSSVRGYEYIREGVMILYGGDRVSQGITKQVYPQIAEKYNTTSQRVERAIRHAIEISWIRGDIKLMEDLFGNSIDIDRSRPTNYEFLSTIADKFKIEERELIG